MRGGAGWTRRRFLRACAGAGAAAAAGTLIPTCGARGRRSEVFVARAADYGAEIARLIGAGLHELGVGPGEIAGRRVLLKPNLVEPLRGREHIHTHPAVVRGTAEAFRALGAREVVVAEGSGHCRDVQLVLAESGMATALRGARLPFHDLNEGAWLLRANAGGRSALASFAVPAEVLGADWVVSLAKMKTHHWAGVTLALKNLFGVLPGAVYGWPKNLLHAAGIDACVADVFATVRPDFAVIDGIVGMEGDGPIMGSPKPAGVLVLGRELPAVDATAARLMGIDPRRVPHIAAAAEVAGIALAESAIGQRGERIDALRTPFALVAGIPAHRGIAAR